MHLTSRKIILPFVAFLALAFIGFLFWIINLVKTLPSVELINQREVSQSTKIYDRTGTILLFDINAGKQRTVVSFDQIPQYLKDATVAVEDENFYNEPAFDWLAILRAVFVDLIHGQLLEGGSTITQQLARNAFLSPQRSFTRKTRELLLAIQLGRHYSKNQILEFYLNEIPYGADIYGVEAASQAYFGKDVSQLDLAESTILVALPRAPTYYSPWGSHPQELLDRQRFILEKLYKLDKINNAELQKAIHEEVSFVPPSERIIKAPHFVFAVEDYLVQKYGEDMIREGGLKVITTLDWDLQRKAEKAISEGVQRNEELYQSYNGALVAEDSKTGQILAMVGSRNYFATSSLPWGCTPGIDCKFEPKFNVATQGLRQPGSALKPFVYLTAFQKGYTPHTVLFDAPTEFAAQNPLCTAEVDFQNTNSQCFHPQNFDEKFRGPVNLRDALAQSINIPSVKVLYLAGIQDSIENLQTFGVTTLSDPNKYGLSLVLGGGAVKLVDLVEAYSVLAQEGTKHQQAMVLSVQDSQGNALESYQDESEQIIDPQYPRLINDILSDAQARAPLYQASLNLTIFPNHDVALKTGTSNDYRDAWAFGYTPSLVVGVWAGNSDNSPMQKNGSSILAAVPILHDFLEQALQIEPLETFTRPEEIPPPAKPMLNGNYLNNNQIHSILFYVSKEDPLGAAPTNPADDPQFANWEYGVLNWGKNNLVDFSQYNQKGDSVTTQILPNQKPVIDIANPVIGSFIKDRINVSAEIKSGNDLENIKLYFNNQLVHDFNNGFGKDYQLIWSFVPTNPLPQNTLTIEATDQAGLDGRAEVIIYK